MRCKALLLFWVLTSVALGAWPPHALATRIETEEFDGLIRRAIVANGLFNRAPVLWFTSEDLAEATNNPSGMMITILTTPPLSGISQLDMGLIAIGLPFVEPNDAMSQALQKTSKKLAERAPPPKHPEIVTQEIHYQNRSAGEVSVIWGIDGWKKVDESLRLPGTFVMKAGALQTPMTREGTTFIGKVQVPYGASIDFGFWITKTQAGGEVGVWDAGYPPRIGRGREPAFVLSTVNVERPEFTRTTPLEPLVTRNILYSTPLADEVVLLWGVNGWQPVMPIIRPAGTTVQNGVMATRMSRDDNEFVARVSVPKGATIDYHFWITKTRKGLQTHALEKNGPDDFHTVANDYGTTTVASQLKELP